MTAVSGRGPWPGTAGVLDAQLTVLGDLAELPTGVDAVPFLVQLAGRGPGADPVGRTAATMSGPPVELGVHGWKIADHAGADLRRARALLHEDLESLAVAGLGYTGPLAVSVLGPWTLAAELYLARGDRVLSDRGAVRDLVAALADAVAEHVAEVRRRVGGADVVVQLDEPLLAQVGAGVLPTFSGYSRLRAVAGPDLVEGLQTVLDAARAADARSVVHVGSSRGAVEPVVGAGADAVGLDLGTWDEATWETIARAVERGARLWAGLPPARVSQCAGPALGELADLVSVGWRRVGLPAGRLDEVTVVGASSRGRRGPGGGVAGTPDAHRALLANLGRVAAVLAERAHA
ncbi:hypothetical protein [Cellulosimicrobium arenosum]|uniref:Methionine synthase n=1 Tax=Cellulosimicrobium arenosum TaxID=2708133 RepID=A0A927PFS4_9MICO|nr:hypothetical protein [Cellulosimicrobium arenosum]MBD8080147.1 hypothetical protein [Cellulosimicrobium arenosum]